MEGSIMSDTVLLEMKGRVGVLTLNRPDALNALNSELMETLTGHVLALSDDPDCGCIVITGSEKAFAAGADIKEMSDQSYMDMFMADFFARFNVIADARLPTIAAVSGYALGGGCELAMICDVIIASDTAKFGQPEIKLGVIPGIGGTQRLTRAVGLRGAAGQAGPRIHDLRHTWASWHVMAGTGLQELMELGCWKSYEMVLRYAHLAPEHLSNAASRIERELEIVGNNSTISLR